MGRMAARTYPKHAEYHLERFTPTDDDELWLFMQAVWNMRIPRTPVCPHHTTPFQAFADAYFARHPVAIWKASRGFGGKSRLLASLVLQEACFLPAQVTILGGSGAQSLIVHAHTVESWSTPNAPKHLMTDDPTKYDTRLANGAWIRSLMASQSSVRGPHPQRLRLDEIDEMELEILEASQGQPMRGRIGAQKGIETQTVMCLAGHSLVLTGRGEVPIESVTTEDAVMTRQGWRQVAGVVMSGMKRTMDLHLSNGRTLTCTDDHRIATPDGWVLPRDIAPGQEVVGISTHLVVGQPGHDRPAQLGLIPPVLVPTPEPVAGAALPALPVGAGVLRGVGVPLGAVSLGGVHGAGGHAPQDVGASVDRLQMAGVAASPVPAQVVEVQSLGDLTDEAQVGPAVDTTSVVLPAHPAVPVADRPLPDPAAGVGVDDAPTCEPVFVVGVTHTNTLVVPVYDLSVDDVHEFTAEGVVVANSSTHQYPDGTMTAMLKRATEMGWPIYEWCWRESANPVDGWLTHDEVERKRNEIPAHMWETEYDLQEPSFEGRAINSAAIEAAFDPELGATDELVWESPTHIQPQHAHYVTGVDWAKEKDRTVISTFDARGNDQWECVAFAALSRSPWPHMVGQAEARLKKYPPVFAHDATGIGNVVSDFFDPNLVRRYRGNFRDVLLASGRTRHDIFTEYVSALESGKIRYPRIDLAYREHLYCGLEDLYGKGHPPDSVVAGAIAWAQRGTGRRIVASPASLGRRSVWDV